MAQQQEGQLQEEDMQGMPTPRVGSPGISSTMVHRLFIFSNIFLYASYYWVTLVDPLYNWFAANVAFTYSLNTPVSDYFRRNIGIFCFLMMFNMHEKMFENNPRVLRSFYFRQIVAWTAWLVLNSITLSFNTFKTGLGVLHILLCSFEIILLFVSLLRVRRIVRFQIQ